MRKRIEQKHNLQPEWFQMAADEKLLFCGTSRARVKNPLAYNAKHPEHVILTDKRLVTLGILESYKEKYQPAVTAMPLHQIQVIQTHTVSWNFMNVFFCIILFYFFIVPGIFFLLYMNNNTGPRVNVLAGILRIEVKFSPNAQPLLHEFIYHLNLHTSFRSG